MKLVNARMDYESVADEIDRLREEKQNALVEDAEREGNRERIREMMGFLNEQPTEVSEYDEQLVRRLVEKITVYEDRFLVKFKAGTNIEIKR